MALVTLTISTANFIDFIIDFQINFSHVRNLENGKESKIKFSI